MMCPYGKRVAAMPKAYRERGTKILIFSGERAWPCAAGFLRRGQPCHARERFVVVAPLHIEDFRAKTLKAFLPLKYSWPVAGLSVLLVDCGMTEHFETYLTRALMRDGASEGAKMPFPEPRYVNSRTGEVVRDVPREDVEFSIDCQLQGEQPWGFDATRFDPEAAQRQYTIDFDTSIAKVAFAIREKPEGQLAEICRTLPPDSLGSLAFAVATNAEVA